MPSEEIEKSGKLNDFPNIDDKISVDGGDASKEMPLDRGDGLTDSSNNSKDDLKGDQKDLTNGSESLKSFRIDDESPHLTSEDGWLDILGSGELKKKVIKNGNGAKFRPERGHWVTLNLTTKLSDGSAVEQLNDLKVILGDSDLVQGLEIAVSLMELGEVAEIIVPHRLAYGELGRLPEIPPSADLNYIVELTATKPAEDEKDLLLSERKIIGDAKRERGNFWYSRSDYSTAIHCYRRALDFLDYEKENLEETPTELQNLLEMRLKVHNNLAASQLKIEAYDAAMKSVDFVLKVQPNNVKALFRKGKILAAKGENTEAIEILKKALKLEPETKIIHQELSRLQNKKRRDESVEKAMYKRMFGSSKPILQPSTKVRIWLQKFGLFLGSLAIVAVGVIVYKQVHSSH